MSQTQKYPFQGDSSTLLDVQFYEGMEFIPLHHHDFCEFVVIKKGSCVYLHNGHQYLLIAGDVFFISPGQAHGYRMDSMTEIYNLQFYPDRMGAPWRAFLREIDFEWTAANTHAQPLGGNHLSILSMIQSSEPPEKVHPREQQRIIHLEHDDFLSVCTLLQNIRIEQKKKEIGFEYMKKAYLQFLLTSIKRIADSQSRLLQQTPTGEKSAVEKAIEYIGTHMTEEIDFNALAQSLHINPNYFRTQFKNSTGLTPIEYVNRSRIVQSLQYLQKTNLTISEIAALVGIYDANYFSRLFRKIMGYSPRYFKNQSRIQL